MIGVRAARAQDAGAVAAFQTAVWREAYAGLVPQDYLDRVGVGERLERWAGRFATGSRQVALAEDDGAVVGVVGWAPVRPRRPDLQTGRDGHTGRVRVALDPDVARVDLRGLEQLDLDRRVDAWSIQVPDAVQVVDLEVLPLDVAGRAAVEGLVLVEVDPAARARWVAQTRTRFYDEAPRRAWIAREALEAIAGG